MEGKKKEDKHKLDSRDKHDGIRSTSSKEQNKLSDIRPSKQPYFFGRITREEAEFYLGQNKCGSGLFLLRECISPIGNYAISVCKSKKIYHYSINKLSNEKFMIPDGKTFKTPVEFISRHQAFKDNLITKLETPCCRLEGQLPVAFRGVSYHQLEKELVLEAKKMKLDTDDALGSMRDELVLSVAEHMHEDMPWYHGKIDRTLAEQRIRDDRHVDGIFIIRLRDKNNSFALTLCMDDRCFHYVIAQDSKGFYSIDNGPQFKCIMMLVDNYHNKLDGLAYKLRDPCCRPGYSNVDYEHYMLQNAFHRTSLKLESSKDVSSKPVPKKRDSNVTNNSNNNNKPPTGKANGRPSAQMQNKMKDPLNKLDADSQKEHPHVDIMYGAVELEDIYGSEELRNEVNTKKLSPDQLRLEDLKLGDGNFGSVVKGVCFINKQEIPVAVKTLKNAATQPGVQSELVKEAEVMKTMDHRYIVRMIGLCEGDPMMLVLELAALGPLNTYLPKHKDMPFWNVLELMYQVSQGMEYLEARNFVHRDLAARNILLVDQHFAKISDFGLSKALSKDDECYQAESAGKWPLRWYAMECIMYWKFDTKTDVWSFGITMWEAMSYGGRPYNRMTATEMIKFLQDGGRLAKPINCPMDVYKLMLSCWTEDCTKRPSFKDLVPKLKKVSNSLKRMNI